MTIGTRLLIKRKGEQVGEDRFGNRYFQERGKPRGRCRPRRWVLYKGSPEASKVPAEWHGWLHYTVDQIPLNRLSKAKVWQKPHLPNLTGTIDAYRPPGDLKYRTKLPESYEPWKP